MKKTNNSTKKGYNTKKSGKRTGTKKNTYKKNTNKKKTNKPTYKKKTTKTNRAKKRRNQKIDGREVLIKILFVLLIIMLIFMIGAITVTSFDGISFSPISIKYTYTPEEEEQQLWDILMEHFDGNETAVLGLMCNIKEESDFKANNLENDNNSAWEVSDEDYTHEVNKGKVSQDDFLESRYNDYSSGFYNSYGQWHNSDGGYGYCQYTAYEKKKALYNYATEWFSKDGQGHGRSFNIADPKMQANFIVYLLENDLAYIDEKLRSTDYIEDAVYIWLSEYECPDSDYHTAAAKRAGYAEEIREFCTNQDTDGSSGDAWY